MGKLIDAEELLQRAEEKCRGMNWTDYANGKFVCSYAVALRDLAEIVVEMSAQHTCETCYYWGNRFMLRDGSVGDCGNFGMNISKDFYCAWWSPKEEKDG